MVPPPSRPTERRVQAKWSDEGAGARYTGPRWKTRRAAMRDPAIVERILARDGARPGLKPVLDAPCGTGRLRGVLERRGLRYVGIDVSWPMLREAQRGDGSGVVLAVVDRMPFRDDSFDVVLCCRLLHHLDDEDETQAVVHELVRVAHRMIVVSFWDAASLHAWRARVGFRRSEGPRGRRALSKRALKRMFDAAGAEIVGFHHSFRFVSQQAFAVALKRAPVDARARAGVESLSKKLLDLAPTQATGSPWASLKTARAPVAARPHGATRTLVATRPPVAERPPWRSAPRRRCTRSGRQPPRDGTHGELRSPGRLELIGRTAEDARAASEIALAAFARAPRHAAFVDVLGETAYFKMSALRGKSAVRYALRRGILRLRLPRLCEYANLTWLRDHGFRAPEPIAAGALWRRGLPRFQFLFTRAVEAVETLGEFLRSPRDEDERASVLDDLAREIARMHALGFVHHDLYARNVLVAPPRRAQASSHIWFLDCWAGGPRPQVRGPTYDYGCLLADLALPWEERERFREVYTAERNARGRPIGRSELMRAIERARVRSGRRTGVTPAPGRAGAHVRR